MFSKFEIMYKKDIIRLLHFQLFQRIKMKRLSTIITIIGFIHINISMNIVNSCNISQQNIMKVNII